MHKVSRTGIMVADIWDVFTPEELEKLFTDIEDADREYEEGINRDTSYKVKLREEINHYLSGGEDEPPKVHEIIYIKASGGFRGTRTNVYCIMEYEKEKKPAEVIITESFGDFYEPPDFDIDWRWL